MNLSLRIFFISLCSFVQIKSQAQEIIAREGSFGIDDSHKIIVWHNKNIDSGSLTNNQIKSFGFDQKFDVVKKPVLLSYSQPMKVKSKDDEYTLYITKLPIVHLKVNSAINDNSKTLGYFTYFNEENYIANTVGIEHRGNLSLTFPKKSYDLEFWADSISKKPKEVKFKGLRNDDDWILDGLYNEPLRIRSTLATKLWLEMHEPHYLANEPKAKSGFDVKYVEVFKNNEYIGIHALSESVDRKLLNLKRNDSMKVRGELFKASSYEGAPAFTKSPSYDNLFPHWGGFEMRYPLVDYRSHWQDLARFVKLVIEGDDIEFASTISQQTHIDNVIDYYLFVNLLRATDNLGKNYFLARYDEANPYYFIPWDLDGVMGIIQDGKRIATADDMLSNGLFDRLLKIDPDGFRAKLKLRWKTLRKIEISNKTLFEKLEKAYSTLKEEKIYERERIIWPRQRTMEDDFEYLNLWLKNRLIYLDDHFENL